MIQEQAKAMPCIEDYRDKNYNPYTAALTLGGEGHVTDLYPELKHMRQQAPIWAVDFREHFGVVRDMTTADRPAFTVLGFREITDILGDSETFSNNAYEMNLAVYFGRSITAMDVPEHTRYRRLFQRAILPNMISAWGKDVVPRIINDLIDDFAGKSRAGLIKDYTIPVSIPLHPRTDGPARRRPGYLPEIRLWPGSRSAFSTALATPSQGTQLPGRLKSRAAAGPAA